MELHCGQCGTPINDSDRFCPNCGARLKLTPAPSAPSAEPNSEQAPAVPTPADSETNASKFTGGAFANFFIGLLTAIVSVITLSLAYPAMVCWNKRWEAEHTYINGRQLRFDGKASSLLGKYVLWIFLTVITLGLYYVFCMRVALEKWFTAHTHFADSPQESEQSDETKQSVFDGKSIALLGVSLLTTLVTIITLSFGSYWAHCYKERWFCKHKTIDGVKLYFDGTAMQYFGKRICWYLLTLITLGIYSFWLVVKSKKWTVHHTKIQNENSQTYSNATQAKKPDNGFAVAGLVIFFLTYLSIVSLILSIVGLVKSKSLQGNGKGLSIAGIVLSSIQLTVFIIILLLMYFRVI